MGSIQGVSNQGKQPKNVAIIIAVSEYENADNLPACDLDGQLMASIVKHSNKFADADVLLITSHTNSSDVKSRLSEFIARQQGEQIGDLFFYFTGHGEYDDQEFYFILSDYSAARRRRTTLNNSELDTMLRALSPHVTIKVVDACNSGVQYIKDVDAFKKFVESTMGGFTHCYFMFSSQRDQNSFAHRLSDFTEVFASAIRNYPKQSMRYKDVIDFVVDEFATRKSRQTPSFVIQATYTEHFCEITDGLKQSVAEILEGQTTQVVGVATLAIETGATTTVYDRLFEKIAANATAYCTEAEAADAYNQLAEAVQVNPDDYHLDRFYAFTWEQLVTLDEIPDRQALAKSLKDADAGFFVDYMTSQLNYSTQPSINAMTTTTPEPSGLTRSSDRQGTGLLLSGGGYKASLFSLGSFTYPANSLFRVFGTPEVVITGFDSHPPTEFKAIKIYAHPQFTNLPQWTAYFVPVSSRVQLRLFSTFIRYIEMDWTTHHPAGDARWKYQDAALKNTVEVRAIANKATADFFEEIRDYLLRTNGFPPLVRSDGTESPAGAGNDDAQDDQQATVDTTVTM